MKGGLGSYHIEPNARLCMASAVTGYISTFGVDEPYNCYDDLDQADVVILWGNNPAEMHPVLFSRIIDRRQRGDNVVLIDIGQRRTRTTEHANHFLLCKHKDVAPYAELIQARGLRWTVVQNQDGQSQETRYRFVEGYDPYVEKGKKIQFYSTIP